jgi:hypothetical protein
MGALASGAAASVGTGAFTAMQADGREANINVVNDANALIALRAGGTDLVTQKDGQLHIDFDVDGGGDGVNPNSTYVVGGLGGGNVPLGDQDISQLDDEDIITTSPSIAQSPAFRVVNQTTKPQSVEVHYDAEDFPEEHELIMLAAADDPDDSSLFSWSRDGAAASVSDDDPEGLLLFDKDPDDVVGGSEAYQGAWLEPGQRINVSLIVKAGDYDPSENNDLSGEIRVRAGSHDEFGPSEPAPAEGLTIDGSEVCASGVGQQWVTLVVCFENGNITTRRFKGDRCRSFANNVESAILFEETSEYPDYEVHANEIDANNLGVSGNAKRVTYVACSNGNLKTRTRFVSNQGDRSVSFANGLSDGIVLNGHPDELGSASQ